MYKLSLRSGRVIDSATLQRTLGDLDATGQTHNSRMRHLSAIEHIEARGIRYSNQDFDVLSAALNFLDAVAPETADRLRD